MSGSEERTLEASALLDDPAGLAAGDPSGMLPAYLRLPEQLVEAYDASRRLPIEIAGPRSVTFCGMGGSATAGDVAVALLRDAVSVPVACVRGHTLPAHCGEGHLVVCLSYSGGTSETLACYREALRRGCSVVAVCSGGELAALAGRDGVPVARVPADAPMPRAALGLLTGAVLGVVGATGVDRPDEDRVREAVRSLGEAAAASAPAVPTAENEAKQVALWVGDRLPVIWGSEGLSEPAAWRWKCAFNENAEVPAFASSLPELDHHEIVGWASGRAEGFALVVLRGAREHPSLPARLAATLAEAGLDHREIHARGESRLAQILSLMLLGDLASTYHALARGVDPAPIEAIARVKRRLAGEA